MAWWDQRYQTITGQQTVTPDIVSSGQTPWWQSRYQEVVKTGISIKPVSKPTVISEDYVNISPKSVTPIESIRSVVQGLQRAVTGKLKEKGGELGLATAQIARKVPERIYPKIPEKYKSKGLYDEIVDFIGQLPGSMASSYANTLETLSTDRGRKSLKEGVKNLPQTVTQTKDHLLKKEFGQAFETLFKNPAVSVALDVSDFIPGIGFIGLGTKATVKASLKQTAKKLLKETVKETEQKAVTKIRGIKPKAPNDVLNSVRESLYAGENKSAKELYDEIVKDFEVPPFEDLRNEIKQIEVTALKEGGDIKFAQYGEYQDIAKKMQSFLKSKAEVTSKVSGELYREHIPAKIFGVSSDEVATTLGKTESEFMGELTKDLQISSGKGIEAVSAARRVSQKIRRIKELSEALKLDKDFYKVIASFDPTKLVSIPSYKTIRPYRAPSAVSVEATEKTLAKIAARENLASARTQAQVYKEWWNSYKSETLSASQRLSNLEKYVKQATNESINDKLAQNAGDVHIFDYARTPENVFKKLGLSEPFNKLRKAHDVYEGELKTELEKIGNWFREVKHIEGSEKRIFDYLDGVKIPLSQPELKIAAEIKIYLVKLAERQGLSQDKRITDYITHIFEPELGKKQIPPELLNALDYSTPRGIFNPFLEKRLGASGYIHDVWRALDAYTAKSLRKIHLDQPIDNFGEFVTHLPDGAQQYTKSFLSYVVGRPDKFESLLDTSFKTFAKVIPNKSIQRYFAVRPTARILGATRMAIFRGTLGLNVGSALKNLTQVSNTFAEEGAVATIKGYMSLLNRGNLKEIEKADLMREIITAEHRMKPLRSAIEKMDKVLFVFFDAAERINRTAAYFAAKSNAIKKGLTEEKAVELALSKVRKTQFAYGKLDTPLLLQNPVLKTAFQFSTFPIKQAELLGGYVKGKQYGRIAAYVMATFGITWAVGDMIGLDYKDVLVKNIFPTLGPVPSLIGSGVEVLKTESEYRREQALEEVKKTSALFIPAFTQAKKTIQGVKTYGQGASTTPTGRVRFEIEKTPGNLLKSAIFGQYSLPGAEKYFENLGKSKSEAIYKEITKLKTNEERRQVWNKMVDDGVITKGNVSDVQQWFKDEELGTTDQERKMRKLGVEDESRAKAVFKEVIKLETNKERVEYVQGLIDKKVVTDNVLKQLENLIETQPKKQGFNLISTAYASEDKSLIGSTTYKTDFKTGRTVTTRNSGIIEQAAKKVRGVFKKDLVSPFVEPGKNLKPVPKKVKSEDELIKEIFPKEQWKNVPRVLAGENPSHNPKPKDHVNKNGSLDRGLMQINSNTFKDFMRRKGKLLQSKGITSYEDMYDREKNLIMARIIWDEQGWKAWFGAPEDLRK